MAKLKDGMKPCPFCAKQPKAYKYNDKIWTIGCQCGCETSNSTSKKGAKRIWNRRRYKEFSFNDLEVWGSNSEDTGIVINHPEKDCQSICLRHKPSGKIGHVKLNN